ncbi:hypothetical protein Dimus_006538 [Dionaea muscipula]
MLAIPRRAYKLFDEITHRTALWSASLYGLFHRGSSSTSRHLDDPSRYFLRKHNVVSWTSTISSLVDRGSHNEAIGKFKLMLESLQRPNYVTLLTVLRAFGSLERENMVSSVHSLVIKMGFESEVQVVTTLIGVYGHYEMVTVWKLFGGLMDLKDVVSWSAMISLCAKKGEFMEALDLLRNMLYEGMKPSYVTVVSIFPVCAKLQVLPFGKQVHGLSIKWAFYTHTIVHNSLIDMYAKCGDLNSSVKVFARVESKDLVTWKTIIRGFMENECTLESLRFFRTMVSSCIVPDESIMCNVIGATSERITGHGLHCYGLKNGFLEFISVGTAFLQMYAKFGEVGAAGDLFNQLPGKDLIAWSAMISAYAQSGQPSDAFHVFEQMKLAKEQPNEITFVSLLQACSLMGAQELGESIQAYVTKAGYLPNSFLVSALIDMYCKFGRIKQGKALFDQSPIRDDLICWSSLINGYGLNGCGYEALDTFSNMLKSGIWPNEVIFVSVLACCGHCGMEDEGWYWFNTMQESYGIIPKLAHYACMADLLSRHGKVEEALEFVNTMPMEPDKRIWGALLAGCRLSHAIPIEMTELIADQLMVSDPENTSCYVFLSNLYAEEGRWKDVQRLRNLIDDNRLRKMTGYSVATSS